MKAIEKIEEIYDSIVEGHPSREDDIKTKMALEYLAKEIDDMKASIEYLLRKNPPSWMRGTPYDLNKSFKK